MQENKWILKQTPDNKDIEKLSQAINVSKPIATMLLQRGIKTYEEARAFFRPNLSHLHNPFLMKNMEIALQRVQNAIDKQESVLIFGDYDVDGTTSVAMMYLFLKDKIKNLYYYVPDRYTEGYGISKQGIDYAESKKCSLIIALDCGIKAIEKVNYAHSKKIDFIIIDHHEQGEDLPKAFAILDPKQKDCNYPFKELSACGLGFKLIQVIAEKNNIPFEEIKYLLNFVVLSIASDIVPIVNENRTLAYYGLKEINNRPYKNIKAIMEMAEISEGNLGIDDLVFKIGPRINAAGRIEKGLTAVDLFTTENSEKLLALAKRIDQYNYERKKIDKKTTQEALRMIESSKDMKSRKTSIVWSSNWHKGVIGIVASRLIEHYYRPTIVFTENNGKLTGSARSVKGLNIYEALEKCKHLLLSFGGHAFAAGLTIEKKDFEEFSNLFEKTVKAKLKPEQETPVVEIDTLIDFYQINDNFFNILKQFAPFGPENMSPIFLTKKVKDTGYGKLLKEEHLKLNLKQENDESAFPAIAFNQKKHKNTVAKEQEFDICYHLTENTYMGKTNLQLNIKDIKSTENSNND